MSEGHYGSGAAPPADRYTRWIAAQQEPADRLNGRGKCHTLSLRMVREFPELRLVAGYYHEPHPAWGAQQHWWCVTPDGVVVDPTASQFPSLGVGIYEELAPGERPVGKCMDCGKDVFPNPHAPTFCNAECEASTLEYLNGPRSRL